jgi:hypothetical protein
MDVRSLAGASAMAAVEYVHKPITRSNEHESTRKESVSMRSDSICFVGVAGDDTKDYRRKRSYKRSSLVSSSLSASCSF